MSAAATEAGVVLGVCGESLSEIYDTIKALEGKGNKKLVIDVTGRDAKETYANAVLVRRTNLKDGDRTFGYPSIVDLTKLAAGDEHLETALAAVFTLKYGSIIVMERIGYAEALPLYGLRQNVFTDPQKPMKVAPGIYPMNGADENAPCMLTVHGTAADGACTVKAPDGDAPGVRRDGDALLLALQPGQICGVLFDR